MLDIASSDCNTHRVKKDSIKIVKKLNALLASNAWCDSDVLILTIGLALCSVRFCPEMSKMYDSEGGKKYAEECTRKTISLEAEFQFDRVGLRFLMTQ